MILVKPSAGLITETDPLKKIELCGRTCYKSLNKIAEDSSVKFVGNLIKSKHFAMLEHACFVFQVNFQMYEFIKDIIGDQHNPGSTGARFLNMTKTPVEGHIRYLVSGNVRAINDSMISGLIEEVRKSYPILAYGNCVNSQYDNACKKVILSDFSDLDEQEFYTHTYITYQDVCDRGVTHEMVRHRPASYAQESTRYCNYSVGKFGGEVTFVEPVGFSEMSTEEQALVTGSFELSERCYFRALEKGFKPQQARAYLMTGVKAEIIMTANLKEFAHFFNLRYFGTTGAPHPDMKVLAELMYPYYIEVCNQYALMKVTPKELPI